MRKQFEMSEADLEKLLDAMKPVPYMVIGGIPPRSQQENANAAWAELGRRMGFDPMSVRPVSGQSQRVFTADAVEPDAASIAQQIVDQRKNAARLREERDNAMARYQAAGHAYTEAMVLLAKMELGIAKEPTP